MDNIKSLIIIGARGFGREVYDLATQCKGFNNDFFIKGFLDDKIDALESYELYPPILSSVEDYEIKDNDVFVCALGDVIWKKKYINLILEKGGEFMNLIHPTVIVNSNVSLGKGIIILSYVNISNDVLIADFVTIQPHSVIGHDCSIGTFSHINSYGFMGGYAKLENEVTLHTKAVVLPKKIIGESSIVGASSVVIKNISSGVTVFGVPAKKI